MISVWKELKRRNVVKVAVAYAIVGWLLVEVSSTIFPIVQLPDWAVTFVTMLILLGFPLAIVLSWEYELTSEGLKRDRDVHRSKPITADTIKRLKHKKATTERLHAIMYKSRCKGVADLELVNSILETSTKNNSANGISGVLIATKTDFLQVLEGEFEALNETFERISHDTRHDKIQLISFTEIEERRFGEWAMHGIGLFDLNHELAVELSKKFGEENGSVRLPSTAHDVMDFLAMLKVD
jgi:hypothetical protein